MHYAQITPEQALAFQGPTEDFLCPITANIYDIEFNRFTIRNVETNEKVFEVQRDPGDSVKVETLARLPRESIDAMRTIHYHFPPSLLQHKTVGAKLVFAVNGSKPVPNFRMIERHYFRGELIKSFDFSFGFCIPNSTNTWESIYNVPELSEETKKEIILNPNETVSDSFYFADDKMIMHNKAFYAYDAPECGHEV